MNKQPVEASGYGLEGGDSSLSRGRVSPPRHCVRTGSGVHLASDSISKRAVLFPEENRLE
jgi:hypothetical protein